MDRALSMENPNYQKQKINGKLVTFFLVLFAVIAISAIFILVNGGSRPVWELLDPKGIIATQQKRLIIICVSILLFAVIPTFVAMFYIVWKYRADKPNSSYSPEMRSSWLAAFTLWSIPSIFIIIIGVINWKSAHALDPYKPIASDKKPLTIQVVALQWKWLFIYPGQNIATVNFLEFHN
jgi:cytochrome o ubiquinol oxidase subunit 2